MMRTIKNVTLSDEEQNALRMKLFHRNFVVPHHIMTPEGWVTPRHAGCWEYEDAWQDGKGHKKVKHNGRTHYVHRLSYVLHHGNVPSGHVIDHTCRNPGCFNPNHLEAVPVKVNTERGNGKWIFEQGYTPENKNNDNNSHHEGRGCLGQSNNAR